MISQDPGLLRSDGSGDVVERHKKYAGFLKRLDIIVLSKHGSQQTTLSENCRVFGFHSSVQGLIKALSFAKRLAAENKYDLIDTQDPHITGWIGYKLKKKFGIKLEVHLHGDFLENKHWLNESPKNRLYNILQKKILPKADAIRVVNKNFAHSLEKLGIVSDKIEVISTPVNEAAFVAESEQNIGDEFGGKKVLLFVGRLVAAKNLIFMLDVIKKLSQKRDDFVMMFIGDGAQAEQLRKKIADDKLSDIVVMKGPRTHSELARYYHSAYLFVLLSTNESFGKVIIEAGFAGLPTIASMSAGPRTVISDDIDGWLVPIDDLDTTVEKLDSLLDQPDKVKLVGLTAKTEFLSRYGQKASFEKVRSFWYKIMNNQL